MRQRWGVVVRATPDTGVRRLPEAEYAEEIAALKAVSVGGSF
jgi:hypothetical protein